MDRKKGKNAAAWGTPQWVATYRWSTMDRKRRRRAERVVGAEVVKGLKERVHTCCLARSLEGLSADYGAGLPSRKDLANLERALLTVDRYERMLLDSAFAYALAKAWCLEKRGGKGVRK